METKKSEKANLEKNRILFIQVGLVIVLVIILLSFEWKSFRQNTHISDIMGTEVIEEITINTFQNQPPPPPPQQQSFELKIVEDEIEIDDDFEIDAEADQTTKIEEYISPFIEEEVEESEIFLVVEEQPLFPGGEIKRLKFLRDNLVYPTIAREAGIEGSVYLNFVI